MTNPKLDRLEAKLKLWDTPGFSQFLEDLIEYTDPPCPLRNNIQAIRRQYQARLEELREQQSKYKQGKLGI